MIKIDIDTRCWQIPKQECFLGVESDDKVRILQFELSKNEFCDGLNFTDCNCFINYKNEGNDTIPYGITDMELQEDGTVTFTWEVSRGATIFKGNTYAILCAKKVSDDGTITNEWNSRIGSFTVAKGIEPLSSITEVPEIDIISQLLSVAKQTNTNAQNNIDKSSSLLEKAEGLGYLKEDFDVLKARMDQFTSLKEGSTTGDAELQDIRVGTDGKTYDTAGDAVRGQIGELKGDLVNQGLIENIDISSFDVANGYITSNGYIVDETSSEYRYTEYKYKLCKDDTILIKLKEKDSSSFILLEGYLFDNTKEHLIQYNSNDIEYTCNVNSDIYVRFCFKLDNIDCIKIVHKHNYNDKFTNYNPKTLTDGYVSSNGALETNVPAGYGYLEVSVKTGEKVKVFSSTIENVSVISSRENNIYTPIVVGDSINKVYEYIAEKDCIIVVSTKKSYYASYIEIERNIDDVLDMIEKKAGDEKKESINFIPIFHKIGVIGDSLSTGELGISTDNGNVFIDKYEYSWLSNIARLNGIEHVHYSKGGLTCKTWLSSIYKTNLETESVKCNAYIIALGTNDSLNKPYPVGSVSDTSGSETFCGLYKQIIDLIKTVAPNSAIFCMSLYNNDNWQYTSAICDICELYNNVYYLDYVNKSDLPLRSSNIIGDYASVGHFSTVGYIRVAENIQRIINEVVSENLDDFKFFGKDATN